MRRQTKMPREGKFRGPSRQPNSEHSQKAGRSRGDGPTSKPEYSNREVQQCRSRSGRSVRAATVRPVGPCFRLQEAINPTRHRGGPGPEDGIHAKRERLRRHRRHYARTRKSGQPQHRKYKPLRCPLWKTGPEGLRRPLLTVSLAGSGVRR